MPPCSLGRQEYCTRPGVRAATSFEVIFCKKGSACGPLTQNSPMCDTSNTPTAWHTVRCSSMMPVYSMDMLYPANSCILAPSEMCFSVNGVVFILMCFVWMMNRIFS